MSKYTAEERQSLWKHVYRSLELPALPRPATAPSSRTHGSVQSGNSIAPNTVSTLALNHNVKIIYPALELLTDPSERCVLHKPADVHQRYLPLPLIPDADVYVNAGRERSNVAEFVSLYKAASDRPSQQPSWKTLGSDMRQVTSCHGKTRLFVVIYMTPEDLRLRVRVRRNTTYFREDGHEQKDEMVYEHSFDNFFSRPIDGTLWYRDIVHLVTMKDDRSARCVAFEVYMLKAQRFPGAYELWHEFCRSWRSPRQPDYEVYLKNLVTEVKRPSSLLGTKTCKICRNPFKGNHMPATLPCCNKLIALPCLVEWCQSFNDRTLLPHFEMPTCPLCKLLLFQDPRTIDALKFGVLADEYWPDKRYTAWENFERSCSDLDKFSAEKSNAKMTVNPPLFFKIWKQMVQQTTRHDEPPHLQPHLFLEFTIFYNELKIHIQCLLGMTTSLSNLYAFLVHKIEHDFRARFQAARQDLYLPPGARGWVGHHEMQKRMWREGFSEFMFRVLNRTLQFHVMRQCRCQKDADFHVHGVREFWHPERCGRYEMSDKKQVLQWQGSPQGQNYLGEFLTERERR